MSNFKVADVEYVYEFPASVEGYVSNGFTTEAVLSMLEADLTRRLQSQVRALLDGGKTPVEIQELIKSWVYSPGARKGGATSAAKVANIMASLPREALLEIADNPEKAREILARFMAPADPVGTSQIGPFTQVAPVAVS